MDIRGKDFLFAHIPGAVNIPFATVAKPENPVKLPTEGKIIVVCYTSQTANNVSAILNLRGYNA